MQGNTTHNWYRQQLHTRGLSHTASEHVYPRLPPSTPSPSQRMDILRAKADTFLGFEYNFPHHTPTQMAEAELSCEKHSDWVGCEWCGKRLRNWKSGDIPWVEHTRFSPHCELVKREMGQPFIEAIIKSFDLEKEITHYCDQHTPLKNDPRALLDAFKESDEYRVIKNVFSNPNDLSKQLPLIEQAFIDWHYKENSSGKSILRATNILTRMNNLQCHTALKESWERFLKDCDEYDAQLEVLQEKQQQIHCLKNERITLFDTVNLQRQTKIKAAQEGEDAKIARRLQGLYVGEPPQLPAQNRPANFSSQAEASTANPVQKPESLEKSGIDSFLLLKQMTCRVCKTNESKIFFVKCGHLASCETCAPVLKKCPFPGCNIEVATDDKIKIYMS
ncbi:RING-HC finger protein [Endozoicomonas sp. ONNA2]|uniref:RING-HC finger protein n=1 Tax=Endozoicomonas sp. ONNA2 TaxID=2828741 RepID=UPI0021475F42|nr:RING-HC finger protein [Endozoicomonas sp. ONNA2]